MFLDSWRASRRIKEDRTLGVLFSFAEDLECAHGFLDFVKANKILRREFIDFAKESTIESIYVKHGLSLVLTQYAESVNKWLKFHVRESATLRLVTSSAFLSLAFASSNLLAAAELAEVYLMYRDRIAARYARKILEFDPSDLTHWIGQPFTGSEYAQFLQLTESRMHGIIATCEAHPEWPDSYHRLAGYGLGKQATVAPSQPGLWICTCCR